jgi:hypothetical protein
MTTVPSILPPPMLVVLLRPQAEGRAIFVRVRALPAGANVHTLAHVGYDPTVWREPQHQHSG